MALFHSQTRRHTINIVIQLQHGNGTYIITCTTEKQSVDLTLVFCIVILIRKIDKMVCQGFNRFLAACVINSMIQEHEY